MFVFFVGTLECICYGRFSYDIIIIIYQHFFKNKNKISIFEIFADTLRNQGEIVRRYEIEQKYRIDHPAVLRARLKEAKARKIRAGKEQNQFWDRKGELRSSHLALRLRRAGNHAWLTLKGKKQKAALSKRLEIETKVEAKETEAILKRLGFRVWFEYVKKREVYRLKNCEIAIDWVPRRGWFAEIEGPLKKIRQLEKRLGLSPCQYENKTYLELLAGWKGR